MKQKTTPHAAEEEEFGGLSEPVRRVGGRSGGPRPGRRRGRDWRHHHHQAGPVAPAAVFLWENTAVRIKDPAAFFGVNEDTIALFLSRSRHELKADSPFIRPDFPHTRYVVLSIDPAGGGEKSDEAVTVFLVAGPSR